MFPELSQNTLKSLLVGAGVLLAAIVGAVVIYNMESASVPQFDMFIRDRYGNWLFVDKQATKAVLVATGNPFTGDTDFVDNDKGVQIRISHVGSRTEVQVPPLLGNVIVIALPDGSISQFPLPKAEAASLVAQASALDLTPQGRVSLISLLKRVYAGPSRDTLLEFVKPYRDPRHELDPF